MKVTSVSEQAARNWFNGEETASLSIDRLAREISAYVESKPENFHLIFLVDEIGQYIGDHSGLMLNLQTVVEELGAKCRGKVWVIVTSQEDIDSVTHVKGNDFSKIQGRFNTRLSLSSASVDEAIKRRILAKTPEAETLLRLLYQQNASAMRNLFSFSPETTADLKGYGSEDEFVESYPFVPYQFKLLQDVLVQVRRHGSSGKHLSGGERSMLSAFQEAAQKVKEQDETSFVPFYRFYDTVHTFLDGAIRRVIDRAEKAAAEGNGLKAQDVSVLKLLFLIRYVDGIPSNVENCSTLMIDSIHADKISLRRTLQESLDRLVHENYVSRSGETYLFLTDEEQDINREIRAIPVDPSVITKSIGEIIFSDIYPVRKFRYKARYDFSFDAAVDNAMIGQPSGAIRLRFVSVVSEIADGDADSVLILQSKAGNEAIVKLASDYDYYHELEEAKRIDKYVKQRNLSQLPESIRKIISAKQSEAKELEKSAGTMLREAIVKGAWYIAGERRVIRASAAKDALDQALSALIENVYSKLNDVGVFAQSDGDLQNILSSAETQESLFGVDAPNAPALAELEQFLEVRERMHMQLTVAEIQKRYQAAPYGWREIDIAALLATLLRAQKIQLIYGGAPLLPTERKTLDCLRKRGEVEKTLVRRRQEPDEELKRKARKLGSELFGVMDLSAESDGLCGQLQALLEEARRKNGGVAALYTSAVPYPGRNVVEKGEEALNAVLSKKGDAIAFLEAFTRLEDELLDWQEDFREVDFFFKNQAQIFQDAYALCQRVQRESTYFAGEPEALEAEASDPTLLDAMITQILTYSEAECRKLEQMIAAKQGTASLRIKTLRRYDLLPQKRLTSEEEVNAFVEALRQELLQALRAHDGIQLN